MINNNVVDSDVKAPETGLQLLGLVPPTRPKTHLVADPSPGRFEKIVTVKYRNQTQ